MKYSGQARKFQKGRLKTIYILEKKRDSNLTPYFCLLSSIVLFAFATIIAWEYQGEKAFEYLTGGCDRTQWYRLGYGLVTFLGAVCSLEAVWDFSDICNGLMAVPNLLAVLMLSRGICREIRKYNFQEI